jgi:hypothetical protein
MDQNVGVRFLEEVVSFISSTTSRPILGPISEGDFFLRLNRLDRQALLMLGMWEGILPFPQMSSRNYACSICLSINQSDLFIHLYFIWELG